MAASSFKVKAVFDYASPHDDDLSFSDGQIITVTEEEDADWYIGEYTDAAGAKHTGLFPKNFVEKYEPAVPSRPARASRPKSEVPQLAQPAIVEAQQNNVPEPETLRDEPKPSAAPVQAPSSSSQISSPPPGSQKIVDQQPEPPGAPTLAPVALAARGPPPAVSEKPSSFKERMAMFNKPAAAPIAPFKPGAPPSGFVKKPFVPPPPSKDAYVPPPREQAPVKVYRREEDPEIVERAARDQENAESAGLTNNAAENEEMEDTPKPTSLKERIALLQKQQMEQANRRADAAYKEKPKKPVKKRTESSERFASQDPESADLERVRSEDIERESIDMRRESVPGPTARRSSRGPRSPDAAQRRADMFSDGNDADQSAGGETTEDADGASGLEDSDEKPRAPAPAPPVRAAAATLEQPDVGEEEDTTEGEDEMDAEARRKLELRERMAKMSGGMGMAGMFGPPGGMPMPGMPQKKTKPSAHSERKGMDESGVISPASPTQTQRMPMVPIPGMQRPQSPEPEDTRLAVQKEDEPTHNVTNGHVPEAVPDVEDLQPQPAAHQQSAERGAPPLLPHERAGPPPIPSDRPVPQPPPAEPRLAPPLPSAMPQSPSAGSESDDEMSLHARGLSAENRTDSEMTLPIRSEAPPALDTGLSGGAPNVPTRPSGPRSPQSPASKRASYFNSDPSSPISPTGPGPMDKRSSRMPPIPISSPTMTPPGHARLPPPPPPPTAAPPSRQPTMDVLPRSVVADVAEGEETEYEGDYDTDIASGATHKDALRSYARDSSLDDSGAADEIPQRSQFLPAGVPPPPPPRATVPRAVPPPPPLLAPKTRQSMDAPRAAPPPIPPTRRIEPNIGDNEYDPYRYGGPVHPVPPAPASMLGPYAAAHGTETPESEDDDLYSASPPRTSMERLPPLPPQAPPHQERPVPPPPSQNAAPPNRAPSTRAPPRQSLDVQRTPTIPSRRSMEQFRPSSDQGFIATDVDLGERAQWWAQANVPPPVFQNRKDVLYEIEESSTSKRGGRTTISKDVYVLFSDYSQTVITARFDSVNTTDSSLEQRHEAPSARLRQDQLEKAHARFGQRIADMAAAKKDTVVGDGTPHGLVMELLRPLSDALLPVGNRAYGALVYANIGNASVQQFGEIRPGDIITLRNAKLQGKHGPMHAKYSVEIGGASAGGNGHVAVVVDWDGTKKKVRAWEQGREKRRMAMESFKFGDLRSGEIKVWRVVGRDWVGWEGTN